jgi:hypothetical protein
MVLVGISVLTCICHTWYQLVAYRYHLVPGAKFGKIASLQAVSKMMQYLLFLFIFYYQKARQVQKAVKV